MKLKLFASIASLALASSAVGFAQNPVQVGTNSSFETWHNYTVPVSLTNQIDLTVPQSWHASDSLVAGYATAAGLVGIQLAPKQQVFKTTDSHSGSAAVELFSKNLGDTLGIQPVSLSNASIDIDINALMGAGGLNFSQMFNFMQFTGGEQINGKVDHVTAWMKNGDSANVDHYAITALAIKDITQDSSVVVGEGVQSVDPSNLTQYTEVTVNLNYVVPGLTPDRLVVVFASSNEASASTAVTNNNSVKIDDVSYTMSTTGIRIPLMSENEMLVYPVPAKENVYFNLKSGIAPSNYFLRITDMEGRVIREEQLSTQINDMNVGSWARGVYFYQLTNLKTNQQQRGKFTLQ